MVGRTLSHYEILEALGAGGMGEVYRARDTTLEREVAIKVLLKEFAGDDHRMARLEREAHTLAALNHPNVATIHGLERDGDVRFLVLELVDGETLADRLRAGAIEPDECLKLARQIAEGLEAAHARGIVHRDLKPANIKVTPDGRVKLLDFGLAKPLTARGKPGTLTDSPTVAVAATEAGALLGTAPYMSPEQARGKEVDERTDIWAFGCVLYEMLSGRRAFEGRDATEVLAAVIRSEPDWSRLPDLPPVMAAFLRRCLAKDPAERVHDIADLRLALQGAFDVGQHPAEVIQPRFPWSYTLAAAAVGVLLAGFGAWWLWPSSERRVIRLDFESPGANRTYTQRMAVAPDGGSVVYTTADALYIRPIDQLEAQPIPGTPAATNPFFSPDGRAVGYWSFGSRELKRTDTSGGATVVIAPVPNDPRGAAWTDDGIILYGQPDGVWRVPATGGTPELILPFEDEYLFGPQLLPDGDSVLISVTDTPNWSRSEVIVVSMTTRRRTVVVSEGRSPRYLPTGHLVYGVGDVLYSAPFSLQSLTTTGPAVPVVRGVQTRMAVAHYAVSTDGTLAYFVARTPDHVPVWVDRQGGETPVDITSGAYSYARLSPDGRRFALLEQYDGNHLWIWDEGTRTRTRLTVGEQGGWYPVWSARGDRIAYAVSGVGLAWKSADNTGAPEVLVPTTTPGFLAAPYQFVEDGGILFRGPSGIWLRPAGADPVRIVNESTPERGVELLNAHRSPNGRWLAYQSRESGGWQVYVRPFPNVDATRVQVSNVAGVMPRWLSDAELLFVEPEGGGAMNSGAMMSVRIDPESPVFAIESRTRLMDWPYEAPFVIRPWDVSADGRRFLVIKADTGPPARTVVVQNWFEELGRLAPTAR